MSASALVLFGATGDLARRMLWPSLYHLYRDGLLGEGLKILGAARGDMPDPEFQTLVRAAIGKALAKEHIEAAKLDAFVSSLTYVAIDAASPASFARVCEALGDQALGPMVHYLATAPSLYGGICEGLKAAGLAGPQARVVLEKPIGYDLSSSRKVNDAVGAVFSEDRVFRVDHYLGKETVQNLMVLRFGNALFEPLWSSAHIEHVQISVAETIGVEGRSSYYDGMGALKDMVQNHMLQLLALVAMEAPAGIDPSAVRNEKIKVLRSLKAIGANEVETRTVAGQYGAGAIDGRPAASYTDDLGAASGTETFVAIRAEIENWRWAGVPFYLRTGKRLPARSSEIVIQFRQVPHDLFKAQGGHLQANKLIIRLQPEETIRLVVMAKEPGLTREGLTLRPVPLQLSLDTAFAGARRRIAYERLMLDALDANPTLFVRRDEVEAAWAWIDGIAAGWKRAGLAPKLYPAGSWGPSAAIGLPERFGHSWNE